MFWTFQLLGWTGYAALRLFHGLTIGRGFDYVDTTAVATVTGFVLTLLMRLAYRPVRNRPLPVVVGVATTACLTFALLFSAIEVQAVNLYDPQERAGIGLFDNAMFDAFVLLAWSGIYFGFHYYRQLQDQREATLEAAARAHQAQLAMLRYQLNPHFLFNTLNAISTLVLKKDVAGADHMIGRLAAFLRHTLAGEPEQKVTLDQELHSLALYLDIESTRLGDRLVADFMIEERAREALVPGLILQPLIENAIKYAVAPREEGGRICLRASIEGKKLHLVLSDDGPGMGRAPKSRHGGAGGVGLENTRARLAALYGASGSLRLGDAEPTGLEISIHVPLEFHKTGLEEKVA